MLVSLNKSGLFDFCLGRFGRGIDAVACPILGEDSAVSDRARVLGLPLEVLSLFRFDRGDRCSVIPAGSTAILLEFAIAALMP